MARPNIVFHVFLQSGYEAGLIEQALRSPDYDISFVYNAMPISQGGYDVLVLEPTMSEWEWLDRLVTFRSEYPNTPVVLYSRDAIVENNFRRLQREAPVFVASDVTEVKNKLEQIIGAKLEPPKSVLFVDDDPNVLKSYVRMLRKSPWKVLAASSGEEALKTLQEESIDLVVTDMKMPQVNGIELVSRIRKKFKELPIIVCSAYPGLKDDQSLKFHNVAGFVEKPVDGDVLKSTIEELLS